MSRDTTDLCRRPEGRRTDTSVQVHSRAPKLPPSKQDSPHTTDVRKDIASHCSTKKDNRRLCVDVLSSLVLLRKRGQEETSGQLCAQAWGPCEAPR